MYLHDELVISGFIFINVVIIFFIYRFFKTRYKTKIKKLQQEIADLHTKQLTNPKEEKYTDTKKSFVSEQIKKMEMLEKELTRQKKHAYETKIIAKEASNIKSKFLSNIKAELRLPLEEIIINAGVLKKELQNTHKSEYAENIFYTANKLLELVNKIIKSTDLQNNSFQLEEYATDVVQLVFDISNKEKKHALQKGLQLSVQVDQNIPNALILDAPKVKDIVENLVQNAVKFTCEGDVKVIISADDTNIFKNAINLSICVQDSGTGIPPEKQKQIFEAFANEDMALGLFISKKMAQFMGGDITLKNNIPKGSVFTLYLPSIEIALNDRSLPCKDNSNVDFSLIKPNGANIMLIDTDTDTKEMIQKSFQKTAVTVYAYEKAKEAIQMLKETHFDMILIDIDILCSEQSVISKVIANISDAPIVTLVTTRVKGKNMDSVRANISGHLKKPVCEAELFKISLQVLNSLK